MPVQYSHINGWLSPSVALPPALCAMSQCAACHDEAPGHWPYTAGSELRHRHQPRVPRPIVLMDWPVVDGPAASFSTRKAEPFFSASCCKCQASIMLDLDRDLPSGPRFIDEPAADQSRSFPPPVTVGRLGGTSLPDVPDVHGNFRLDGSSASPRLTPKKQAAGQIFGMPRLQISLMVAADDSRCRWPPATCRE
jgi:hypothetical protein